MKIVSLFTFFILAITAFAQNDPKLSTSIKFDEVISSIDRMYVDDVNAEELTNSAIVAMLEKLDPHSTFISKDEVDDANEKINGNFVGVGIRFQILKDTLHVVSTIPGGPSEKIGILAGDQIILISDSLIAGNGLKNSDVRGKLLGEKGTKVDISVKRGKNSKLIDFTITRDVIPVHSVDAAYMVTNETGYIKLNSFSRTSLEEIQESLKKLKKDGMQNLILDLQGNGGGLLYAAKYIADEFLSDDKLIVYSEGRSQPRINLNAEKKGMYETGKLILLTDEYSASASEILSGAIQDWDRGLIVGRRTYGKGLVQRPIDLSDGSQIRLTIARYYTPSGRFIQKPYNDVESYRKDILERYEHGEFMNQDSIQFPDSLKLTTLIKKRTVYSGGGIMPDYFVPLDTAEVTPYFSSVVRGGHINRYSLTYVNKNRAVIEKQYPVFSDFKSNFIIDKKFMDDFFAYLAIEDPELEFNKKEYATSEKLLKLQFKAMLAQDIWGYSEFYQIYNDSNEILQKAIQIIESGEYTKANLSQI